MHDTLIKLLQQASQEHLLYPESVADFLLGSGVIVPPCRVGDKVYFVCVDENCENYIDKGKVYAISQNENTLLVSARYLSGLRYDHISGDFGKTIFLTKEEAEKHSEKRYE